MIAFSNANNYFEKRNCSLLGLSIDSNPSHLAWMYDIYLKTGIVIPFPIISDRNGKIARSYGMIASDISNTETVRNVYIIDPNGIIRLILIYPLNVGRCISEILRSLEALQIADKCGGATPANWTTDTPIINPVPKTYKELEERMQYINKNKNGLNWYLSFKNSAECSQGISSNKNVKQIQEKKNT